MSRPYLTFRPPDLHHIPIPPRREDAETRADVEELFRDRQGGKYAETGGLRGEEGSGGRWDKLKRQATPLQGRHN